MLGPECRGGHESTSAFSLNLRSDSDLIAHTRASILLGDLLSPGIHVHISSSSSTIGPAWVDLPQLVL